MQEAHTHSERPCQLVNLVMRPLFVVLRPRPRQYCAQSTAVILACTQHCAQFVYSTVCAPLGLFRAPTIVRNFYIVPCVHPWDCCTHTALCSIPILHRVSTPVMMLHARGIVHNFYIAPCVHPCYDVARTRHCAQFLYCTVCPPLL